MAKPVLQAMVLADRVYRDGETGKYLIIGTFGAVKVKNHPTPISNSAELEGTPIPPDALAYPADAVSKIAGSPYLYIALTEVPDSINLLVRYSRLDEEESVVFEGGVRLAVKTPGNPIALREGSVPLPPLVTSQTPPGAYSLDLVFDGEILGSWRVTVVREEPKADDQP